MSLLPIRQCLLIQESFTTCTLMVTPHHPRGWLWKRCPGQNHSALLAQLTSIPLDALSSHVSATALMALLLNSATSSSITAVAPIERSTWVHEPWKALIAVSWRSGCAPPADSLGAHSKKQGLPSPVSRCGASLPLR